MLWLGTWCIETTGQVVQPALLQRLVIRLVTDYRGFESGALRSGDSVHISYAHQTLSHRNRTSRTKTSARMPTQVQCSRCVPRKIYVAYLSQKGTSYRIGKVAPKITSDVLPHISKSMHVYRQCNTNLWLVSGALQFPQPSSTFISDVHA
jgi:hypothetical protein